MWPRGANTATIPPKIHAATVPSKGGTSMAMTDSTKMARVTDRVVTAPMKMPGTGDGVSAPARNEPRS